MKAIPLSAANWSLILVPCLAALVTYIILQDRPCVRPIEYRLGDIDDRFGLSKAQATDALAQASALWNSAAGRTLFSMSPNFGFAVDFIYSDQQNATKRHQAIASSIEDIRQNAKQVGEDLERMKEAYFNKRQRFEQARNEFDLSKSEYDTHVTNLNNSGGASASEAQLFEMQRATLSQRHQELQMQVAQLGEEAGRINFLTSQYNAQVNREHADVDAINVDAGQQFLAGEYRRKNGTQRIEIYQFGTFSDLVAVLAHELGHALGLGHNNNPKSIMSPSSEQEESDPWAPLNSAVSLSKEDFTALRIQCQL